MTSFFTEEMPRKKGDKVTNITASNPDIPICHNGKYQTETPNEVKIDQYTNPRYVSEIKSPTSFQSTRFTATYASCFRFLPTQTHISHWQMWGGREGERERGMYTVHHQWQGLQIQEVFYKETMSIILDYEIKDGFRLTLHHLLGLFLRPETRIYESREY